MALMATGDRAAVVAMAHLRPYQAATAGPVVSAATAVWQSVREMQAQAAVVAMAELAALVQQASMATLPAATDWPAATEGMAVSGAQVAAVVSHWEPASMASTVMAEAAAQGVQAAQVAMVLPEPMERCRAMMDRQAAMVEQVVREASVALAALAAEAPVRPGQMALQATAEPAAMAVPAAMEPMALTAQRSASTGRTAEPEALAALVASGAQQVALEPSLARQDRMATEAAGVMVATVSRLWHRVKPAATVAMAAQAA